MAIVEKDLNKYVSGNMACFFVPVESNSLTGNSLDSNGKPNNMRIMCDLRAMHYVINANDRIIAYVDDSQNLAYILSSAPQKDLGYNGEVYYQVNGSRPGNTSLVYSAQTAVESNIAASFVTMSTNATGTIAETTVPCVDYDALDIPVPEKAGGFKTQPRTYTALYSGTKLPTVNTNYALGNTKETTSLILHIGDNANVYMATCPTSIYSGNNYNGEFRGTHMSENMEQLANACIGATGATSTSYSQSRNSVSTINALNNLGDYDSRASMYDILITHDYNAALKFIDSGTIPPDAYVIERGTGADDDSNESGEDGNKSDTFDENEPTAPTVNSSKLSNLHHYWISETQMQNFYTQVWNTDLTDFVKGAFTGIYSNLISNVISLKFMPTTATNLGGQGEASAVILGFKTYDELTVQTVGTGVAPIVDIGSYKFTKEYNSFADYAPYTDMKLYLPFVGIIPLDTNLFMGKGGGETATLKVKAQYDLQSGLITYFVLRNKTMITSVSGNMAVEVPISLQSGIDTANTMASNFTNKATSFVGNAVSGNPIGMVSDILQGSTTSPPQTIFSSTGGDGAFYAHPKCMIMIRHPQYNRPKNYSHVVGYPAYVTKKVSDLQGFNIVQNPVIPLADGMTGVERDMIVSAMQSGLYY